MLNSTSKQRVKIKMPVKYFLAKVCEQYNAQYGERAKMGYKLLNIFPLEEQLDIYQDIKCEL